MAITVAAVNATATAGNTTTHNCNLPSGIAAGHRVIACVTQDGGTNPMTWPSGWTQINAGVGPGTAVRVEARYRECDGTEGATITITGDSESWCSRTWRITGHSAAAPEAAAATGTSGTADPPNLAPSWGSKETLWIVYFGIDNISTAPVTTFPTDFNDNQHEATSGGSGGWCAHGSATRVFTAASLNPDAFANDSEDWRALTIAVEPAAAGAGVPVKLANYRRRRG
jgi:hypothetical protein